MQGRPEQQESSESMQTRLESLKVRRQSTGETSHQRQKMSPLA